MALLKPVPPPSGAANAWATFWLLGYDIPVAQVDAAFAQEREHLNAWALLPPTDDSPSVSYVSRTGEKFFEATGNQCGAVEATVPIHRT